MTKEEKIKSFDPNSIGSGNIFGLPFSIDDAQIVIVPVPWEVTVSYKAGTANAPDAILKASHQVDLFDPDVNDAWKIGIAMEKVSSHWKAKNISLRKKSVSYIGMLEKGTKENSEMRKIRSEINKSGIELKNWLKEKSLSYFKQNKLVVALGGDHSTPLGLIEAIAEKHGDLGILHIDAHFDLRNSYEGFEYSHASIMHNVLKIPQVKKIVPVGIRDYCEDEILAVKSQKGRVMPFYFSDIQRKKFSGETWNKICAEIINSLPQNVYISFDIDGLDAKLCPNTGTPVPGGLEFEEATFLINELVNSKRKIIGFDLNEVASSSEWDANVGARLLYLLCNLMAKSNR